MPRFRQIVDDTCHAVPAYTLHNDGEFLLLQDFPERRGQTPHPLRATLRLMLIVRHDNRIRRHRNPVDSAVPPVRSGWHPRHPSAVSPSAMSSGPNGLGPNGRRRGLGSHRSRGVPRDTVSDQPGQR